MKGKRLSRRDILQGAATLAAGAVFAAPVRAQAPEPVAITPALVEAAKKEGKLVFYSSMDLPVGEKLGKAFEAAYPGVTVQIERSGSERLFQRIDQEFASSIRAVDVINTSDASHIITWKRNKWLAPFVSEDMARHFLPEYRDPDHHHDRNVPDGARARLGIHGKAREAGVPTVSGPTAIFASAPHPHAARLFQAWFHTRQTQQFFCDYTAQYSVHAQVQSKPGRRKLSDIKLMKEDAEGVEKMAEEIKTRYARLFKV